MNTNSASGSCNDVREEQVESNPDSKLLEGLEGIAYPIERESGSILFCEGESGGIFLLCRGRARLTMYSRTGEKLAFRTVGPGYFLGLAARLRSQPYNFTAELLEDSRVAFIRNQDIPLLLRRRGDLCLQVVRTLSHELRRLQKATILPARPNGRPQFKVLRTPSDGRRSNDTELIN